MKKQWCLAIFVILVSACVTGAQVRPMQGGQALDANYLIGSGGRNTIRYRSGRFNTNLYVTGQATGGFSFRGRQPYAAANQLSIDLPSADFDPFIRDSVGVQQVLSGVSYGPNRYLSAGRTVLSAGAIAEGLNAPGTSIPRATYLPKMSAKRLYNAAINAYRLKIPDLGRQMLYNPLIQPTLISLPTRGSSGALAEGFDRGAARPAASALFGILRKSDRENLAAELLEAQNARRTGRVDSRVELRVEEPIQPLPGETEPKNPDETTTPDNKAGSIQPQASKPGQDVFIDMLRTMEDMRIEAEERSVRQGQLEDNHPKTKVPLPDETGNPDGSNTVTPAKNRAVRKVRDTIVLSSLAGRNRDLFNLNMSRAEKKLAAGEYYAAGKYYDLADMLNRGNPLASLGAGLALFAADEPLSAAFRLRQAMKRFPPLMATRVDVQRILDRNVVGIRIVQLEQRLADKDEPVEPALVFLAAFIRASMNQPDMAAKHAETLMKIAGEEKTYRLYAEHLLKASTAQKQTTTSQGS